MSAYMLKNFLSKFTSMDKEFSKVQLNLDKNFSAKYSYFEMKTVNTLLEGFRKLCLELLDYYNCRSAVKGSTPLYSILKKEKRGNSQPNLKIDTKPLISDKSRRLFSEYSNDKLPNAEKRTSKEAIIQQVEINYKEKNNKLPDGVNISRFNKFLQIKSGNSRLMTNKSNSCTDLYEYDNNQTVSIENNSLSQKSVRSFGKNSNKRYEEKERRNQSCTNKESNRNIVFNINNSNYRFLDANLNSYQTAKWNQDNPSNENPYLESFGNHRNEAMQKDKEYTFYDDKPQDTPKSKNTILSQSSNNTKITSHWNMNTDNKDCNLSTKSQVNNKSVYIKPSLGSSNRSNKSKTLIKTERTSNFSDSNTYENTINNLDNQTNANTTSLSTKENITNQSINARARAGSTEKSKKYDLDPIIEDKLESEFKQICKTKDSNNSPFKKPQLGTDPNTTNDVIYTKALLTDSEGNKVSGIEILKCNKPGPTTTVSKMMKNLNDRLNTFKYQEMNKVELYRKSEDKD